MTVAHPDPLRRQFALPAEDEAFLAALGLAWETIIDAGQRWVIVYGEQMPAGFNHPSVTVAILMQPGYPPGPLDMVYVHPHLVRTDGRICPNTDGRVDVDGRSWQQWSRHRVGENAWVPGEDNLESHYFYMRAWLADEVKR